MKQLHHISLAFAALLGIVVVGCSEEVDVRPLPSASDVEIVPMAAVSGTRAALSGAQDGPGFPASTDSVFAVSAFLTETDGKYDDKKLVYDVNPDDEQVKNIGADLPYFKNQPVRTDEDGNFHFNSDNGTRYYPEDGSHVYFYAFSPACATQDPDNPKKVSWTLTGQEDIMYARDFHGIRKAHGSDFDSINQPQPEFEFEHLLVKINFNCRLGEGFPDGIRLSKITVNGPSKANLDLKTGKLDYYYNSENATEEYVIYPNHRIYASETFNHVCSILYPPNEDIKFKIEAVGAFNYDEVTMNAAEFKISGKESDNSVLKNGYVYNINLIFEGTKLSVKPSVDSWKIVEESSNHEI